MKKILIFLLLNLILSSCNFLGPKNINWKNDWKKNESNYKRIIEDIKEQANKKYKLGENPFPPYFKPNYDDTFYINRIGKDSIENNSLTVYFYYDRGLLDHYSALIYTNDSLQITGFEKNVENGGNDFKLENNWYIIND